MIIGIGKQFADFIKKRWRIVLGSVIGLIFLATALFLFSLFYGSVITEENSKRIFIVESGWGVKDISLNLREQGIIKNSFIFEAYVLLKDWEKLLKAGKYEFGVGVTAVKIAEILASGRVVNEDIAVTIPEGFTLRQIEETLRENGILLNSSLESFRIYDFAGEEDLEYLSGLPADKNLEGFLFPDSYKFNPAQGDKTIIGKMLKNFDENVGENLRRGVERQELTLYEGVILASILEREVPTYEDRKIVAGLLLKRMRYGMPLQVDAALTYVTGRGSYTLTKADLESDSPYNTYKNKGLPPTPISNPGTNSLWAVASAQSSPYWFYLSKPDGTTVFSQTFEKHVAAKNKYLR